MYVSIALCPGKAMGAWKLHPYNSDAMKSVFYHKTYPFGSIWNMLHTQNFAVMMMLVTIMLPRTKH